MRAGAKLDAVPASIRCPWRGTWRTCACPSEVDATSSAKTTAVTVLLIIGLLHITETSWFMRRRLECAEAYFLCARKRHRAPPTGTQRAAHLATRLPAAAQLSSDSTTVARAGPCIGLACNTSARTPPSGAPAHAPVTNGCRFDRCFIGPCAAGERPAQSIFGLSSSCARGELRLALVTRTTPVSIRAGTCSP